ncbi:hypothetical protein LFX25_20730 [Leptospira sp. FAT2]|uniref:hypothetical protein n=1 Tax=Leptospira sanjuanensis TaxID=2879643 RepID=UPI001EE9850E|nr:hypothetical protein [Leptospira sanjuanensis]MCG6195672.1 hypothetical protein [Leptospira sanjuanensis]
MEIVECQRLYYSALYDFAYLEKHFFKSSEYRPGFSVRWNIVENGVPDTITDTVPMPDLFHHLQFSHSFIEKFLKYYIAVTDRTVTLNQILDFKHNLPSLLKRLNEIVPDWNVDMVKSERDVLLTISQIHFPKLRYVKPQPQTFTVNFRSLRDLLIHLFEYLKRIRFENTSSISQEQQDNNKVGRIFGYVERKVAPERFENARFDEILRTENLSSSNRELIRNSYLISGSEVRLQVDENNSDLIIALEAAGVVFWDFWQIRFEITYYTISTCLCFVLLYSLSKKQV